ncbi:MAG: hypothetical protein HXY44_16400 [Syntrophaceae bacterium]|nr:hypothetical protein [Syntrophaceae bacterium]
MDQNLCQKEFAKITEVNETAIHSIERGEG